MKEKLTIRKLLNFWKLKRTQLFYWLLRDVIKYGVKPLSSSLILLLDKIHYLEEEEINGVVTKIKRVYSQNKVMLTD